MLGDLRVKMEQYYQDNRRYSTDCGRRHLRHPRRSTTPDRR